MIYKKQIRGMLNIYLWTNDLCDVFDTQLNKVGSGSKLILIFSTKQHTTSCKGGLRKILLKLVGHSNLPKPLQILSTTENHYTQLSSTLEAFDVVWHDSMLVKLYDAGLTGHKWSFLKNWYTGLQSSLKWDGDNSLPFPECQGVRQGGIWSPTGYKHFLNPFLDCLRKHRGRAIYWIHIPWGCWCSRRLAVHGRHARSSRVPA